MKKNNILSIVLALVAVAAIVLCFVFNGQKADLQKKADDFEAQVKSLTSQVTDLTGQIDQLKADAVKAAEDAAKAAEEAAAKAAEEAAKAAEEAAKAKEPIVITVYDAAANVHGEQKGWFAKVIKDRFNIVLDIIAPQVAGQEIFATRAEDGDLGDIILVDKSQFPDLVNTGLVKDISDTIVNCENLMKFKDQIDHYNKGLTGEDGKYYGIPTEMTDTSATTLTDNVIYSSPMLRWDLYKAVGCPEIKNLDDLLDVLAKIHEIHMTNDAGDKAYPFTLWADWDNNDDMMGPANVVQLTTWYGEKVKRAAILKKDNTFTKIYDRDAAYYKITKFLNKANQMGLVDPESGEQDWNRVCAKMTALQVDMMWYSWSVGFTNVGENRTSGRSFIFIPIADQTYYADTDAYYGTARMFGVGSKVSDEKYDIIMKFLDWYAGPEGMTFQHVGIEGLNYTVNEDGTFTQLSDSALANNEPVPEAYVGEDGIVGYNDGYNAINQWIGSSLCINPNNGERFASKFWSSYIAAELEVDTAKREWQEVFGAKDPVDYISKHNMLQASPSAGFAPDKDTPEMEVLRNQLKGTLCEYTWKAIFAKSDDEFEQLWDAMIEELTGFEYDKLYEYDVNMYQKEVDMKNEVLGK